MISFADPLEGCKASIAIPCTAEKKQLKTFLVVNTLS